MSDSSFLKHLFTEELYALTEKNKDEVTFDKASDGVTVDQKEKVTEEIGLTDISLLIEAKIKKSSEKELLSKVLSAVGFSLDQVAIIEPKAKHSFIAEKTICFGDDFSDYYSVNQDENGNHRLYSRSLSTLEGSLEDKKSLWTALKKWFTV